MNDLLLMFGEKIEAVFADNIKDSLNNINFDNFKTITEIEDARSAAFNSFGKSKASNKNVVLFIKGDYISNIYTVCTEAWFQQTNLIVIAIYDSIYDIETHFLDRCSVLNIKFYEKDLPQFINVIQESLKISRPKIINIVMSNEKTKYSNYTEVTNILRNFIDKDDKIYCYKVNNNDNNNQIIAINEKYKYGIISKYLGYTLNQKNVSYLIIDESCFKVDSNILNSRYINKNFKIILFYNNNDFNIDSWVINNEIKILKSSNKIKDDIQKFCQINEPCILMIKGEY